MNDQSNEKCQEHVGLVTRQGIVFGTICVPKHRMSRGGRVWIARCYKGSASVNGDYYNVSFAKTLSNKIRHYHMNTNLPIARFGSNNRLAWAIWENC